MAIYKNSKILKHTISWGFCLENVTFKLNNWHYGVYNTQRGAIELERETFKLRDIFKDLKKIYT